MSYIQNQDLTPLDASLYISVPSFILDDIDNTLDSQATECANIYVAERNSGFPMHESLLDIGPRSISSSCFGHVPTDQCIIILSMRRNIDAWLALRVSPLKNLPVVCIVTPVALMGRE